MTQKTLKKKTQKTPVQEVPTQDQIDAEKYRQGLKLYEAACTAYEAWIREKIVYYGTSQESPFHWRENDKSQNEFWVARIVAMEKVLILPRGEVLKTRQAQYFLNDK